MSPTLHRFSNKSALAQAAANSLWQALCDVSAKKGQVVLGLAGGSSPIPVLEELVELPPVDGLIVTWIDERHHPVDISKGWEHLPKDSNERGAWRAWLSRAWELPQVVSMHHSGTLQEAKSAYEQKFESIGGKLDVLLLGIGPDGHLASLFPNHPLLQEPGPVLSIANSPKPPAERLTLSLPVLEGAEHTLLVVTGEGKARALLGAQNKDQNLPIGRFNPTGTYLWFVDNDAASLLGDPS